MLDGGSSSTPKKPRKVAVDTGIQWVERKLNDSEDCYNMFRMRRSFFLNLHEVLVRDYGLTSSKEMCSKEALGMFLWICGAPQSNRQAKEKFTHSGETISRRFTDVLECVYRLAANIIKPRDPLAWCIVNFENQDSCLISKIAWVLFMEPTFQSLCHHRNKMCILGGMAILVKM